MIEAHAQAVLGLLTAAITSPRKVFLGKVDPPVTDLKAAPYVLVRFSAAPPDLNFLGVTHVYAVRFTCYCVGASETAAMQMADLAEAAVQDITPAVTGRTCYPIRFEDSAEQPPDEATGATVASQVRVYLLRSVPA